jgi:hypothetical protein
LDRESQFLLKSVISGDYSPEDLIFRIILFRHFNSGKTWNLILDNFGNIDLSIDFKELAKFLDNSDWDVYNKAYMLTSRFTTGKIYNKFYKFRKYWAYFEIFKCEIIPFLDEILCINSLEGLYRRFIEVTGFGPFVSYQIAIDLNYSNLFNFGENDFVEPGIGSKRGIDRCFDNVNSYKEVIEFVTFNYHDLVDKFSNYYNIDLKARLIPNRELTFIDIQNCFCEVGKYIKTISPDKNKAGEKRMSHKFYPKYEKIDYVFPDKWQIGSLK